MIIEQQYKVVPNAEPVYHVLYVFDPAITDFIELGIYTKRDDAEAHQRAHIEATGCDAAAPAAGAVVQITHAQLCHNLAMRRLGPMAKQLEKLTGVEPVPYQRHERSDMGVVQLYGPQSNLPILCAQRD